MFKPYLYQERAINVTLEYLSQKEGNPIIAMPTGTGKSIVISFLIKRLLEKNPSIRLTTLTHVKELIGQNADKFSTIAPNLSYGICSAGLNRKQYNQSVIFGGIATIKNIQEKIGFRDFAIIDECHLISNKDNTMYHKFFDAMRELNPNFRIIGLTATPYRMGQGLLTNNGIFTDFAIDLTSFDEFNLLLEQGYIAPLIPRKTETYFNLAGVKKSLSDYNETQLQEVMNDDKKTQQAIKEIFFHGKDRKKWLIFATGIAHAESIAKSLREVGVSSIALHSNTPSHIRDIAITDFKEGRLRSIVNNNVLTTGFDCPDLDLIAVLRPTMSVSLWVQILGRGTRPFKGKIDCLVLDFAGNTARLGCINDPLIPKPKGKSKSTGGMPPIKICPQCSTYHHPTVRVCIVCGHEFPKEIKIEKTASTHELIRKEKLEPKTYIVNKVIYEQYQSKNSPNCLIVKYVCENNVFREFLPFEKTGAMFHAIKWWKARFPTQTYGSYIPKKTIDAFNNAHKLITPKSIVVEKRGSPPKPKIIKHNF